MKLISLLLACSVVAHSTALENFLHPDGDEDLNKLKTLLSRADIGGVQMIYSWKSLEIEKDTYNFSEIESDLYFLTKLNKKLFIQIQDRFFQPEARNIPDYLLEDPLYGGGLVPQNTNYGVDPNGKGWTTQQWNPNVRERYQKLLEVLGKQFDGKVFGINLPETAIDIDKNKERERSGFSCDKYFHAEMENLAVARNVFKKSHVVQYVNFWPCEWNNSRHYMGRMFAFAAGNGIGLGGPDIVPYKKEQMNNSYPFFRKYKDQLSLIAMAVQEPTLTYLSPNTNKSFTEEEFTDFAKNYLGADIIFWSTNAPWLKNRN